MKWRSVTTGLRKRYALCPMRFALRKEVKNDEEENAGLDVGLCFRSLDA